MGGLSDAFVTDFGQVVSVFIRDTEGPEPAVCVADPTRLQA